MKAHCSQSSAAWASFLLSSCLATLAHGSECIAPAKPNAGFDLTCELISAGLQMSDSESGPMTTSYMPGGIGAVAYNVVMTARNAESNTLVAFSGGSLMNIAQGRFGKHGGPGPKWLASIGIDHGVLIVRKNSPFLSLRDLIQVLRQNPDKLIFGGSGTIGSQDWMKVSLIAFEASKLRNQSFRFVGFEGGGEANSALQKGYVDVVSGDYSEALGLIRKGADIRILTVLSEQRLPNQPVGVQTALEAGYRIVWPNFRGIYMGPATKDVDYQRWVSSMKKLLAQPAFSRLRSERGLLPLELTGDAFAAHVNKQISEYSVLVDQLGLTTLKR